MREKGVRAPLLRTVEYWLRGEHEKFIKEGKSVKESPARAGEDFLDLVCVTRAQSFETCEQYFRSPLQNAKSEEGKTFAPNGFAPGRFYGYTPSETQGNNS